VAVAERNPAVVSVEAKPLTVAIALPQGAVGIQKDLADLLTRVFEAIGESVNFVFVTGNIVSGDGQSLAGLDGSSISFIPEQTVVLTDARVSQTLKAIEGLGTGVISMPTIAKNPDGTYDMGNYVHAVILRVLFRGLELKEDAIDSNEVARGTFDEVFSMVFGENVDHPDQMLYIRHALRYQPEEQDNLFFENRTLRLLRALTSSILSSSALAIIRSVQSAA
jgi:hypothetical protein